MSTTESDTRPVDLESTADEDGDHFMCCVDQNTAICGVDITEHPYVEDLDENICKHCRRLDDAMGWDDECTLCPLNVLGGAR